MKQNTFYIISLFFLILSCKKDKIRLTQPQSEEGNTVFYFEGTVGQEFVHMEAGKADYYMFTNLSYDTMLKTFLFEGVMTRQNCTNCGRKLAISITDDTTKLSSGSPNINGLISGTYLHFNPSDSLIKACLLNLKITDTLIPNINFSISLNGSPISYSNTVQNYTLPFNYLSGNQIYTLTISKSNGNVPCYSSVTNTFFINNNNYFYCYMTASSFSGQTTYKLYSNSHPQSMLSYSLFTGDGYSLTINNVPPSSVVTTVHQYSPSMQYFHPVLVAKNANGNISTFSLEIDPISFYPSTNCAAPQYTFEVTPKFFKTLRYKVMVKWTNDHQQEYVSTLGPQPPGYDLKIISVDEYEKNMNNKPTKKITGEINVRLYQKNNPSQWLDLKGKICWAIAY